MLSSDIKDEERKVEILTSLGNIYKDKKEYKKAEKIYTELLSSDIKDEERKVEILTNLGNIYKDKKEYEKAEKIYKKALTLSIKEEEKKIEILFSLGCVLRDMANCLSEKQLFCYIKKSLNVFVDLFKKRHLIKNKDIKREFVKIFRDTCRDFRKLNKKTEDK